VGVGYRFISINGAVIGISTDCRRPLDESAKQASGKSSGKSVLGHYGVLSEQVAYKQGCIQTRPGLIDPCLAPQELVNHQQSRPGRQGQQAARSHQFT